MLPTMFLSLLLAAPFVAFILIPMKSNVRVMLAAALVCAVGILFMPKILSNKRLADEGIQTTGEVTGKSCGVQRNLKIDYTFAHGGRPISGSGKPGKGNQSCDAFKIGDQVFITYLDSNPAISVPEREVSFSAFFLIAASVALFFVLVLLNREQTRSRAAKSLRGTIAT